MRHKPGNIVVVLRTKKEYLVREGYEDKGHGSEAYLLDNGTHYFEWELMGKDLFDRGKMI
jgi:hypothetical protein